MVPAAAQGVRDRRLRSSQQLTFALDKINGLAATEHVTVGPAGEPVSPELVLVDPVLARYARARLPDPPKPLARTAEDVPIGTAAPQTSRPGEFGSIADRAPATAGWESEDGLSIGARWRSFLLLIGAVVLASAILVAVTPSRSDDTNLAGSKARVHEREAAKPVQKARTKKRPHARVKKHESGSRARASGTPARARSTARAANSSRKPKASSAVPTKTVKKHVQPARKKLVTPSPPRAFGVRLFIWPATAHATFYKVAFFRHQTQVFEAFSSKPRLELPLRWTYNGRRFRLTSGEYSWTVWPAFGARAHLRFGKPIVLSTWRARR
jgi:hypothetical protein